jgi:hypothetical protein
MAGESALQMAREAKHAVELLAQQVELLVARIDELDLLQLRDRVKVVEQTLPDLVRRASEAEQWEKRVAIVEGHVADLNRSKDDFDKLTVRAAVTDDRVNKLEKKDDEAGKRVWQFLFVLLGVVFGVVGNLIVSAFKPH